MSTARALRDMMGRPGVIRLIGAHNALGARLAERAGFDGVWSSGLEISTSYAVPDANILTMSEYLATAEAMAEAVRIPVVADCDTGYGNSNNVIHMVRKFEAAGIAAVCIEDKLFPKVNSFVPGRQELAPIAEFVGKIMAAKNAQRSPDFVVIARIEALIAGWGQDEALKRAHAYVKAGADAIVIHGRSASVQPVAEFLQAWDGSAPVVVIPTTYPDVTATELERLGAKIVIYANQGLRAAVRAMEETYQAILATGSSVSVEGKIASMETIFDLQGMPQMKQDEAIYLRTAAAPTRAIILAAGDHMGAYSMKHIAEDIPMAMLDVNGKPLLQRQLETLHQAGIRDVTVVSGYRAEAIQVEGVTKIRNLQWQKTGEAASLMCALNSTDKRPADERTLVIYGDILFDHDALIKLQHSDADITMLVDRTYGRRTVEADKRLDLVKVAEPPSHNRRFLNQQVQNRVVKLGKLLSTAETDCEFTGLVQFSPQGLDLLCRSYRVLETARADTPFHEASSLHTGSLTDLLQELIDNGHEVRGVEVTSGWLEIHSFDDYQLACKMVRR